MSVEFLEREMEVEGVTARERVLGNPDMLEIIFSYLDPPSVQTVRLVSRYFEHPIIRVEINSNKFEENKNF